MKLIGKIFLIILVLLIHACNMHEKSMLSKERKLENKGKGNRLRTLPAIISSDFFLENRVDNCDSAIHFMQNVIKPCSLKLKADSNAYFTSSWNGFSIPGESKTFLDSEQRYDKTIYRNNRRYYISLNCLVGQKLQTVLDIFVEPMFHDAIIHDVKIQERNRNFFTIEADGFAGFTINIVDGIVKEASFSGELLLH